MDICQSKFQWRSKIGVGVDPCAKISKGPRRPPYRLHCKQASPYSGNFCVSKSKTTSTWCPCYAMANTNKSLIQQWVSGFNVLASCWSSNYGFHNSMYKFPNLFLYTVYSQLCFKKQRLANFGPHSAGPVCIAHPARPIANANSLASSLHFNRHIAFQLLC